MKHSTRQRFVSIEFNPPEPEIEKQIIQHESGVDSGIAESLAKLGEKIRNLKEQGLEEGASTRLLIYAGKMIAQGISPRRACQISVNWAVTDDYQLQKAIEEVICSIFE